MPDPLPMTHPLESTASMDSTIVALSTPRGQGGIAVIRLSGPESWTIAARLFSRSSERWEPGRAVHGWIEEQGEDGAPGVAVDEVLVLPFRGPHSFTGEDVVEIHGHGGIYVSRRIIELCLQAGAAPAQPGEFTRRAFLNGRLDLTQAESVMDIIGAQGEAMLRMANTNLRSRTLAQRLEAIVAQLIEVQSPIVAAMDFPDEVDEPERGPLLEVLKTAQSKVTQLLEQSNRNQMAREGLKVAILGKPNAGKSSLFNVLLASERSIVTEIPGTTRDIITEQLVIGGVPVTMTDTAGIREALEPIEAMGVERSYTAAAEAQCLIYVVDSTTLTNELGAFPADDEQVLARVRHIPHLIVANKTDALSAPLQRSDVTSTSITHGVGVNRVMDWLEQWVELSDGGQQEDATAIALNQRQTECLAELEASINRAYTDLENVHVPMDLVTVSITSALRAVDRLFGRDSTETVLDEVFHQFCVGK